jgi:hypothetical protein
MVASSAKTIDTRDRIQLSRRAQRYEARKARARRRMLVVLGDYVILGNLTALAGRVRLQAMNQGGIIHNVGIRGGPISGDMRPGKGFTIDLGQLAPGTYELYCDIVGHVERGMVANLVIT